MRVARCWPHRAEHREIDADRCGMHKFARVVTRSGDPVLCIERPCVKAHEVGRRKMHAIETEFARQAT